MIDRTFNQEERSNLTQDKRMVLVDPGDESETGERVRREVLRKFRGKQTIWKKYTISKSILN